MVDIDFSDLRLAWPADLVREVAARLAPDGVSQYPTVAWLMAEAFVDSRGLPAVRDDALPGAPLSSSINLFLDGTPEDVCGNYLNALIEGLDAGTLKLYAPARYYRRRAAAEVEPSLLTSDELGSALCEELAKLDQDGYFDDAFGPSCCDARGVDRAEVARAIFIQHLGADTPWRWIPGGDVDVEHVYDLVELCHDLVARPMTRSYHGFCEEWDYADFDRPTGRLVYRWRINKILARSDSGLRMSPDAQDLGRLVASPSDPRAELPSRVLDVVRPGPERNRIQHAITLFRDRHATREVKRDAVRSLGDVLEHRRAAVKEHLGSRDEGALFEILNKFDIRHLNRATQGDYDDDFLEWVFWTFLASLAFMDVRAGHRRSEDF